MAESISWTKKQSDMALKHIERANYELGTLIERIGDLSGDVKVIRNTIENEIRTDIGTLKQKREEDSKTLLSFKENCFRCRIVAKNWHRFKWMLVGTGFTILVSVLLYFLEA
jgi:hypothetical protein